MEQFALGMSFICLFSFVVLLMILLIETGTREMYLRGVRQMQDKFASSFKKSFYLGKRKFASLFNDENHVKRAA